MAKPAPCGLVCAICSHIDEGCPGCAEGGGDPDCFQRQCCRAKDLVGCWECGSFPCDRGFFGDEAWRGLCIGFVQSIQETGADSFLGCVRARLGDTVDYGHYRFKSASEIRTALSESI